MSTQRIADPSLEAGRLWACASYAGILFGLPIFIAPLALRDNELALYHAKHAAVAFGLMYVLAIGTFALAWLTCGLGIPLLMLAFLPILSALHGLVIGANGEKREPILLFGLAQRLMP